MRRDEGLYGKDLVIRRNGPCTTQSRFRFPDPPGPVSLRMFLAPTDLTTPSAQCKLVVFAVFDVILLQKKAALSEQTGVLENGLLRCSFHRKKSYPRDPSIFDLHNKYYLMVAVGEALKGTYKYNIVHIHPFHDAWYILYIKLSY